MVSVSQSKYLISSHLFILKWICLSCIIYYFSFTHFCVFTLFCPHFDIRFLDFLKCVSFLSHILPIEVVVNSHFQFYAPRITSLEQGRTAGDLRILIPGLSPWYHLHKPWWSTMSYSWTSKHCPFPPSQPKDNQWARCYTICLLSF